MTSQQDIYAAGTENRPPMLNKENYITWSSCLLCYAKCKTNGKLIVKSIIEGPYVRRTITVPDDPDRTPPVLESTHEQTDDELTKLEAKQVDAADQAIQIFLMGLPEDVYAVVESCEIARDMWLRVQKMMKGSEVGAQEKETKLLREWEKFTFVEGEQIETYFHRFSTLMNHLDRNHHTLKTISSNIRYLDSLPSEWSRYVTSFFYLLRSCITHNFKMTSQQDIYAAGTENRPPMLNKEIYTAWSRMSYTSKETLSSYSDSEEQNIRFDSTETEVGFKRALKRFFGDMHDTLRHQLFQNINHLLKQLGQEYLHEVDTTKYFQVLRTQFEALFTLKRIDASDKESQERVIFEREWLMKAHEVHAIKQIEKRLNEMKMQTQEEVITEGTSLDASLVTQGIALDASLVANERTVDSITSSKQQYASSSSGNDADTKKTLADTDAFDSADIGPSYNCDTSFKVHTNTFENVFANETESHEQPDYISDTHVVNKNNNNIMSDIPHMDPNRDKEEHDYVGNEQQRALLDSSVNHESQKVNAFLTNKLEKYKKKEQHFAKDESIDSEYRKKIKLLHE
ncbi:hypothetical protein Tco_1541424 [Tanacetum coccineum]